MKASLRLLFTILFGLVFSNSSNLSNPIDSSFLSVPKFGSKQLTIDYFLDVDSDFDEISKQTITELLENSIQVASYLLQEIPSAILPSTSRNPLCLEFNQLTSSQISSSDIILLVTNDKETKKSLSFEDCSSATYPQN
ncbi:unnamed protein product [Blepharisma stoltei]|uniref:Uncharacterized protein n=1 Tax=Blepharisma stoltei TaxID=1481888 RepID=A0AAU9IXS7_9CILI|nr:unnamed protein product [Blepharisma stoltei]